MPEQVALHIHRLSIPLPDTPLGTVNAYAILSDNAVLLIDCGWNTPQAYEALVEELAGLGKSIQDIQEIVVTHIHPDHFGLAQRLVEESGAHLFLHRLEAVYVGARYDQTATLVQEMEAWLRVNGVPPDDLEAMAEGSLGMLRRVGTRPPDVLLEGGERIDWGAYSFEVLWTPGHSAGHICLHDAGAGVFICGDHVLQRISPHVGLHVQSLGNPLADYLDSLRLVRELPVDIVLPGHGRAFDDLAGRVDELIIHHDERLGEMLAVLEDRECTAYHVAASLPWRGSERGWEKLAPFQRRMAVTETVAHLEYVHGQGRVKKRFEMGNVLYRRA